MNVLIDLLGASIIASMLVLMMITFHFQMYEATDRTLFTMNMIDHMDMCATKFNSVIALAGIGFDPDDAVIHATPDSLVFNTYWNFQTDQIQAYPVTLTIRLASVPNPYGTAVVILQDGVPLDDLGHLFWINQLKFRYYNKNDVLTTDATKVRSAEVRINFFRQAPRLDGKPIIAKLQFKCFFMNAYLRGA